MSRLDALRALKKAVEDGTATPRDYRACWPGYMGTDTPNAINARRADRDDDLNAARALHDAVRPGGEWVASFDTTGFAQIWKDEFEMTHTFSALVPGKPARAWLLAVIASLIDEEDGK
jgi:hypothetical protein